MIPILRPADVRAIDERALANETLAEILERVGQVVATEALAMMTDPAKARVLAIVGPGLNGADAKAACQVLTPLVAEVSTIDALNMPASLAAADLIIDGAFGIGLSRDWQAPATGKTPVLAIDIPSGIHGISGEAMGRAMKATRTVTLGGYKAGLLFGDGPDHCGEIVVRDIGLGGNDVRSRLVEAADLARWLPRRPRTAHKWNNATLVVAGSASMVGAARLCTSAAFRAGSGYVHLLTLAPPDPGIASEVVRSSAADASPDFGRFAAAVVGPGLGRSSAAADLVHTTVREFSGAVVVDGDGLSALAATPSLATRRHGPTVLTPHDGEFERLAGRAPGQDRIESAKSLARLMNSTVLLKGPSTVIASPEGDVRVTNTGDQRLATAGTGDVLAGILGAFLAQGLKPFDAASAAAYVHGLAASLGQRFGLVASDLLGLIPDAFEALLRSPERSD